MECERSFEKDVQSLDDFFADEDLNETWTEVNLQSKILYALQID